MTIWTRLVLLAAILAVTVVTASCGAGRPEGSPASTVCDDVSSEVGGCAAERHDYLGTTCEAVAAEWGGAMDRAVMGVVHGPANVTGEARSSRLRQAIVIATIDMDQHLESLALPTTCSADDVLTIGEREFSPELRTRVGSAMFDGDPVVGYQEWLEDVRKVLRVIEQ